MFPNKYSLYSVRVWMSFVFSGYGRRVVYMLTPVLIFIALYSSLSCYLFLDVFMLRELDIHSTMTVHSLLGIVLGLFLVFRMNSAYDRWWEGRKQWGLLVNNTRNLSFKIDSFLDEEDYENRNWFAGMISNFVYSLKEHLRDNAQVQDLVAVEKHFFEHFSGIQHIPNRLSLMMYRRITALYKQKGITGNQLFIVDKELKQFSDILGACERIKNTPIPYSYKMYIKKFIFLYLITLPFAFVTLIGYMTILATLLITYVLLGIELIAEEIEDPFGRDLNDLPVDKLSCKIRNNVHEILLHDKKKESDP